MNNTLTIEKLEMAISEIQEKMKGKKMLREIIISTIAPDNEFLKAEIGDEIYVIVNSITWMKTRRDFLLSDGPHFPYSVPVIESNERAAEILTMAYARKNNPEGGLPLVDTTFPVSGLGWTKIVPLIRPDLD